MEFCGDVPLVVFLGGNDILNGANFDTVKSQYLSLVRLIRRRHPSITLFLVCLPIFPRCVNNPLQVNTLNKFNLFLNSLSNDKTFSIPLNLHLNSPEYFHAFYPRSSRTDLLHLNQRGYQVLIN